MIQALERSCSILEYLGSHEDEWVPLGAIAPALGLHPATCANLLQTLLARGYVEQQAPRKGYRLGPTLYLLTRAGPPRRDLVALAEPVVASLADRLQETVLLAALSQGRRYTLCEANGNPVLQLRREACSGDDPYDTITGRVLLAHLSPEALGTFLSAHGLPGARWPQVRSRGDLLRGLARLRGAEVVVEPRFGQLARAAAVVREGEQVVAALGVYLPAAGFTGPRRREVLSELGASAARLSSLLSERLHASHTSPEESPS